MTRLTRVATLLLVLGASPVVVAAPRATTRSFPGIGPVTLYAPAGAARELVLFLSGDGGWNLGVVGMAEALRDQGALVAGIDIRAFLKSLEASRGCAYPAGALEELARSLELEGRFPEYRRPILVGYSSGATLAYAALVAAPPETFAGAVSLGFCPDLELRNAPCQQRGLRCAPRAKGIGVDLQPFAGLGVPWMVLQGEIDQVCDPAATQRFVAATGAARLFSLPKVGHGFGVTARWQPQFLAAYRAIADAQAAGAAPAPAPHAQGVEDLGLVELPASGGGRPDDAFAVLLTGDGGWAEIDKQLGAGLVAAGIPVVGWSSLRYYWTPRTPEAAASDLARVIQHYAAAWSRPRVLLVGYSFGADVLPFLVNRLPAAVRSQVGGVSLLGLSATASFEFHVAGWLGGGGDARYATAPEVARLAQPVLCVHGAGESDSACPSLRGPRVTVASVGSGHHFGGDYARVVELVLATAR